MVTTASHSCVTETVTVAQSKKKKKKMASTQSNKIDEEVDPSVNFLYKTMSK